MYPPISRVALLYSMLKTWIVERRCVRGTMYLCQEDWFVKSLAQLIILGDIVDEEVKTWVNCQRYIQTF